MVDSQTGTIFCYGKLKIKVFINHIRVDGSKSQVPVSRITSAYFDLLEVSLMNTHELPSRRSFSQL
jgi:hypothetical protein